MVPSLADIVPGDSAWRNFGLAQLGPLVYLELLSIPQHAGQLPTTENYLIPHISSVMVEKPWVRLTLSPHGCEGWGGKQRHNEKNYSKQLLKWHMMFYNLQF